MGQYHSTSIDKVFLTQKKMLQTMLGISSMSSCRKWFKKLEILHIPSLYIYSLMLFVVDSLHYFPTNSSVHEINTRYKNHFHTHSLRLLYSGTTCSAIKIYNKLPQLESQDLNMMRQFSSLTFRKHLLTHICYSIQEFLSNY